MTYQGENYPQYAQASDTDFSAVVLVKDTKAIGSITLSSFGTDDKDVLKQVDTAKNVLPMPIFSPIALSNHAKLDSYKVLKSDSILAYDYEKTPFFINLNLTDGSLSAQELENLAKSIVM